MEILDNLRYTKDHEWIRKETDGFVVGITDYAQKELGDIVYLEIETEGENLEQEEVFGTVEAVKTVSDILMPISGEVIEVNPDLENEPELVNKSPYKKGWLIKISASNESEYDSLLTAQEYEELIS